MRHKIYSYFSHRGGSRKPRTGRRRAGSADAKHLNSDKAKLKARLKLVGEETRRSYTACENHDARVKAAYSRTYMSTRFATIPTGTHQGQTVVRVIDSDTLDFAMCMNSAGAKGPIGVLNMASDKYIGGGFLTGAPAQEESLCRRSTLYPCLMAAKDSCYPIPATGVVVSPDVFVFRTGIEHDFRIMPWEECFFVTVLSVAALRNPRVRNGRFEKAGDEQLTTTKVRQLLRAAYHAGCRHLVLWALGCGAFNNPPTAIAAIFRSVLQEPEYQSAFESIVFAVIDSGKAIIFGSKTNNFGVFRHALDPELKTRAEARVEFEMATSHLAIAS